MTKTYELPKEGCLGSRRVVAEFDENGIAKITEQALDSLICELNEYAERAQKTGHWTNKEILKEEYILKGTCSKCGKVRVLDEYCSNCGAKMNIPYEPQESEESE